MRFLCKVFRIKEWFNSKLIIQIGFFILLAFWCKIDSVTLLKPFFIFVAFMIICFALGYMANDLSDIKSDKKVGKQNAFENKGIGIGIIFFVVLTFFYFLCMYLVCRNPILTAIIVLGYFIGIFYSFKPVRFKERGALGIIVSSLCQRNLPLMMALALLDVDIILFILINVLNFTNGVRYILIHQYNDYDNDIKSETTTFVTNKRNVANKLIFLCFCVELSLMIVCCIYVRKFLPEFAYIIPVGLFTLELSLYIMIKKSGQSLFTSYDFVPLDFFYLVGIPATFLLLIGLSAPGNEWGCFIIAVFLIKPIYSIFKLYLGYVRFFLCNSYFIYGCRHLWKITNTIGKQYFINVEPVFEDPKEEKYLDELQSYAIISPCKVRVPFSIIKSYLKGGVCRELVFNPNIDSFEQPMKYFQLKNKSMLHYFAIYIIPKEIFWTNRKPRAAETIVNCIIHSGTTYVSLFIDVVECGVSRPNKDFYAFYGLACSELYFRRNDCFISVFPSFLMVAILWLIVGIIGVFFYKFLFIFSVGNIVLFCFMLLIDKLISIRKIGIINTLVFNKNLYCCKYSGKSVPLFKRYGIYTDLIVAQANQQRNRLAYAICAMIISLIVVCCLASIGLMT